MTRTTPLLLACLTAACAAGSPATTTTDGPTSPTDSYGLRQELGLDASSPGGDGSQGPVDGQPATSDGCQPRPEICNGQDDDCDGKLPADEQDPDGDGVMPCHGRTTTYSCTKTGSAPAGGGEGYGAYLAASGGGATLVSTKAQLLQALKSAKPGTVIYVKDDVSLDLSSEKDAPIEIRGGLTLASGRGKEGSLGALIFTNDHDSVAGKNGVLFRVVGDKVRISGLRVRGPSTSVGSTTYETPLAVGIYVHAKSGNPTWDVEIDNCELYGWPNSAVSVSGVHGVRVHHIDMHHNRRTGLGYGVVTSRADPVIGSNVFNLNRHAIACTGYPGSNYEACHNIVLPGANGHAFDMHGGFDKGFYPDAAGTSMQVHHNTFLISAFSAVLIRGVPEKSATITSNSFVHPSPPSGGNAGIAQRFWPAAPGCLSTGGCVLTPWASQPGYQLMQDKELCRAACSPAWITSDPADFKQIVHSGNSYGQPVKARWMISFGGQSHWLFRRLSSLTMAQIGVGDFDGDGADDAFYPDGSAFTLYRSARFTGTKLVGSAMPLNSLGLGDFDGDGKTDVFRADGSTWWVSWGGTSSWKQLNSSGYQLPALRFADFDGDGKTDVARADGSAWWVSYGGASSWKQLNSSAMLVTQVALGDFDGDGKADIFRTDGSAWWVSWGGTSSWKQLGISAYQLPALRFGDFDGDGKTDLFLAAGGKWSVSYGGTSGWKTINSASQPLSALGFGDFNGDGKTDVLTRQ